MTDSYELFKTKIFELTNIDLNAYKERQMKRRIDTLISKYGIDSYIEYVTRLRTNRTMYEEFLNYITINVSEFYRNPEQWNLLEKEIFPYLIKQFGNNLKIWSSACSTGDEPYSIVMLLSKFMPLNNIKVIASDIDQGALRKANLGMYHEKSLKSLPNDLATKFFNKIDDKTYQIKEEVKARVEFKTLNLLKDSYPTDCNLIICRNVLIYFTDEAKHGIYQNFSKSLKKDGLLFVGSTEQIIQPLQYNFKNYHSFFYQKLN